MTDSRRVVVDPTDPLRRGTDVEQRRRIGAGGMGVVCEAFDNGLRRRMAIKVLNHDRGDDRTSRLRFIEEAQIASQLDHPNIIPVHELGHGPDGGLYFTMKLVEGDTLSELLFRSPPVYRTSEVLYDLLQIFLKICDAVAFAHSRGVIHRDLKPDNVMVGPCGEVYLMDWGIAKVLGMPEPEISGAISGVGTREELTGTGCAVGTPGYMAPEQASGRPDVVDQRSDVFSLGAILYQLLTSEGPFPELSLMELLLATDRCEIKAPQERTEAALPPRLCTITMKALAKDPEDRYQDVPALKADLERFLQSGWQFPTRTYAPGALIIRKGQEGMTAYAIVRGTCQAFREEDGHKKILRTMGRGEVFGETAVFSQQLRTASVEAVGQVTVLEISRTHFEEELGMGFWMGLFVKALAERFTEKEEQIGELERELAELRGSPRKG